MYKVANYELIILTPHLKPGLIILIPPLKHDFMSKYQKTIGPRNNA